MALPDEGQAHGALAGVVGDGVGHQCHAALPGGLFRIVIEDLFSWFDSGLGHLNFTKNLVLFLFTFQMKTRKLCNFNNHAAFSRNHHYVVNNSG